MSTKVSLSVFKDPEGNHIVIPCGGTVGKKFMRKMREFDYQHIRTLTEEVPDELDVQRLLDLIAEYEDADSDLSRALWGITSAAYAMGKGSI